MSYFIEITEWGKKGCKFKITFKKPLQISSGRFNDKVEFEILDPNYFVSADSGEILDVATGLPSP
jgi:hypothetical protein